MVLVSFQPSAQSLEKKSLPQTRMGIVIFPRPFCPTANLLLAQHRGSEEGSLHPLHSLIG